MAEEGREMKATDGWEERRDLRERRKRRDDHIW